VINKETSAKWTEWILCYIQYATYAFKIRFFDKKRANVVQCSECIQGSTSAETLENYKKQLLQMWRWVKEATKCPKRTIWRILGHQIKAWSKRHLFQYSRQDTELDMCDIDDFNKWVIQHTVHRFCVQEIT